MRAAAGAGSARAPVPAVRLQLAPAQSPKSQQELAELREAKLAKPVFRLAPWVTDYDAARAAAAKEGKLIFAYFTRSYAH